MKNGRHRRHPTANAITLVAASRVWASVGVNSFGGPAGQIAVIHREVVDERGWLDEDRFIHALNFCMLLPGPEAQQLATYLGWLLNGVRGGVIAGSLFVLPGFLVMMALSITYAVYGQVGWVAGALFGLQAAVVAVVIQAVIRVSRRSLLSTSTRVIAAVAFSALWCFHVPFPVVILVAGTTGWLLGRNRLGAPAADSSPELETERDQHYLGAANPRSALRAAIWALGLWLTPVIALYMTLGKDHIFTQQAILFSKAAIVTFGGAYSVLAYISQQAVGVYGWIQPADMVTGLGLAETTPGPLIMVVQFVGFLAAFNHPGSLAPLLAGVIAACITVWVTFLPCFFFIFLGAPYIENLRNSQALRHALAGIGAAVVGVILNLAVWFALSATFATVEIFERGPLRMLVPEWSSVQGASLGISAVALVLVFGLKVSTMRVLATCAALGIAMTLA